MANTERRKRFIINAAYFAVIGGIVLLLFRRGLGLIGPFAAAFAFSWMLMPAVRWLTVRRRWRYKLAAAVCLAAFFAVLGGTAVLITTRLAGWITELAAWLPGLYADTLAPGLDRLALRLEEGSELFGPEAERAVNEAMPDILSSVGTAVTGASVRLVSALSGWAAKLPRQMLSAVVCGIATVFITLDFPRITAFLLRQVPERPRRILHEAKESFKTVARRYGRGYAILLGITFAELLIGFLLLRQKNAVGLAALIAVFDIFPVVGAGLILVPWGIAELAGGAAAHGAGLLILWALEVAARQVLEPRILGHQVGLHPLVTLMAVFIGSKLFGGVGLIGLPIACAVAQSLEEAGVVRFIKRENPPRAASPDQPRSEPDARTPILRPKRKK